MYNLNVIKADKKQRKVHIKNICNLNVISEFLSTKQTRPSRGRGHHFCLLQIWFVCHKNDLGISQGTEFIKKGTVLNEQMDCSDSIFWDQPEN